MCVFPDTYIGPPKVVNLYSSLFSGFRLGLRSRKSRMNVQKLFVMFLISLALVSTAIAQDDTPAVATVDPALLVTTPRLSPDDVPSESPEESCEDKLRLHIEALLKNDTSGILEAQLNLTILKLAKKTLTGSHKSLEDMIKKDMTKLKDLNAQKPATLERLNQLYGANANEDIQAVYNNIGVLKARASSLNYFSGAKIENDAVASYVLYETMLNEKSSPFDKNDVAIAWLAKKIKAQTKSEALSISDQVGRYAGAVKGIKGSDTDIAKKIANEKRKITKFMETAKAGFMSKNPACAQDGDFNANCLTVSNEIAGSAMLEIDAITKKASSNFAAGMAGRILENGSFKGQVVNSCEGRYYDRSKAKVLHSTRTSTGTADQTAIKHNNHAKVHPKPKGWYFPPVTCSWHGKKFFLEHIIDKKEQCCKDKITKYVEYSPYLMWEFGGDCRAFYGIPYIAEVGIKGGVEVEAGIGGKITLNLETCADEGCVSGKGKLRPFLALYAEAGAGLATIEGGVRWEPYIEIKWCKSKGADSGHGKVEAVLGTAYIYGQYSLGWGMKISSFNYPLASSSAKYKMLEF